MKSFAAYTIILSIFFLFNLSAEAQQASETEQSNSADVTSMDAILTVLYDVISGEQNVKRDWPRFQNLFYPGAQLIATNPDENGKLKLQVLSPQDYVQRAGAYLEKNGFFEKEIARKETSSVLFFRCSAPTNQDIPKTIHNLLPEASIVSSFLMTAIDGGSSIFIGHLKVWRILYLRSICQNEFGGGFWVLVLSSLVPSSWSLVFWF